MNLIILIFTIIFILAIVIILTLKQNKDKGVIKSEIMEYKIIEEKNTPHTHLYEVKIRDKRKPITLSIDKGLQLEKGQIITYKIINKKARFIMLEQPLNLSLIHI